MVEPINIKDIDVVLLDIEGTICSILFVKDVLYPYFNQRFESILQQLEYPLVERPSKELLPHQDPKISELNDINNIVKQFPHSNEYNELVLYIRNLVAKDIKDPVLKSFQGFIWKLGYEKGDLVAPIYEDAIRLIRTFSTGGKVYIYSSGSVKAQKLLFNYVNDVTEHDGGSGSTDGAPIFKVVDLNAYLSGYFDITTSGYKQDPSSYKNILNAVGYAHSPEKVLFFSDNVDEIRAAKAAGLNALIVHRPGNNPVSNDDAQQFGLITNFNQFI